MASWLEKIFESAKQGHRQYNVHAAEDLERYLDQLVDFLQESNFQVSATYTIPGKQALLEVSRDGYSGAFDMVVSKPRGSCRGDGRIFIFKAGDKVRESMVRYDYYRSNADSAFYKDIANKTFSTYIARTIVENSEPKKRPGFFQKLGM